MNHSHRKVIHCIKVHVLCQSKQIRTISSRLEMGSDFAFSSGNTPPAGSRENERKNIEDKEFELIKSIYEWLSKLKSDIQLYSALDFSPEFGYNSGEKHFQRVITCVRLIIPI